MPGSYAYSRNTCRGSIRLQATSQRIRQRQDSCSQYITSGGALQDQEVQVLVAAAQMGMQDRRVAKVGVLAHEQEHH
jgi:hypothetical protein